MTEKDDDKSVISLVEKREAQERNFAQERRAELLDHPRLAAQLCSLERSAARSGRENISHPPNSHDDVANCAAIALVSALATPVCWEAPIVDIYVGYRSGPPN